MPDFDLFVSYSRVDDANGWVSGLVEVLQEDQRAVSTEPLRVFFDREGIRAGDDWKLRLGQGLRHSRVMLACISPNYFASEYCRWEWEEFARYRGRFVASADAVTSIYFVHVGDPAPEEVREWMGQVARVQHVDVEPWFPQGRAALAEAEVRARLAELGDQIAERSRWAGLPVVGNLRRHNERFVGRSRELVALRESLWTSRAGTVTVLHGMGGQGKSELAVTYAHVNRHSYGGGSWMVACEGLSSMAQALARLAPELGVASDGTEEVVAGRVLADLVARAAGVPDPDADRCLLVLDNVDHPGVLSAVGTSVLQDLDRVHVVAPTRMSEAELAANRAGLAFLPVYGLDADSCFELLCEHHPGGRFDPDVEGSARELAGFLAGFTLGAEQAAVYLGMNPDVTPGELLEALQGDSGTAELATATGGTFHAGTLEVILERTWDQLPERAQAALAYAALLPPDLVSWEWLEQLVETSHPTAGLADRWGRIQRILDGRRLIEPSPDAGFGRLHRLTGQHLRARHVTDTAREAVELFLDAEVERLARMAFSGSLPAGPVMQSLIEAVDDANAESLARYGPYVTEGILNRLTTDAAHDWAERCLRHARSFTATDPTSTGWGRDLTIALDKVGDIAVARGDLAGAEAAYRESLDIRRGLAAADPGNTGWARDLTVALDKVGDIAVARGDLKVAEAAYRESLDIRRGLVDADPANTTWTRDLTIGLNKVGDIAVALGDLDTAETARRASLNVMRDLAAADPTNTGRARDLTVHLVKVGDIAVAGGDLAAAEAAYRESLDIARDLAAADPGNTTWTRDLTISLDRVGDIAETRGDLEGAEAAYRESLDILRDLVDADPTHTGWARDLTASLDKVGNTAVARGDLEAAETAYRESLNLARVLVDADPIHTGWARDLTISLIKVGDIAVALGDLDTAEESYHESLDIMRALAAADPTNTGWARDLSVSLVKVGDVAIARGDLDTAEESFRESLNIGRDLAAADPGNTGWARDLTVSLNKVGDVAMARSDLDTAEESYHESLDIMRALAAADPPNTTWTRDLTVSLDKVARTVEAHGDDACPFWSEAFTILGRLHESGRLGPGDKLYFEWLGGKVAECTAAPR